MNNVHIFTYQILQFSFFISFLIVLLTKKKAINNNISYNFYLVGCIFNLISIILNIIFYYVLSKGIKSSSENDLTFIRYLQLLVSQGTFLIIFGIINQVFSNIKVIKHQKTILVILFTVLTFGVYSFIWFLKKFNEFGANKKNYSFLIVLIILFCINFSFILTFWEERVPTYISVSTIVVNITYIVFFLINIFSLQNKIEKTYGYEFNILLTLLFGIFYTQYKINKLIENSNLNQIV